jgi:uncharacterized membrane protein
MSCQLTADSIPLKIFFEINVVASIEFLALLLLPKHTHTIHNKDFRKYKITMIRPIGSTHAVVRTVVLLSSLAGVLLPKTLVAGFAPIATNNHHLHGYTRNSHGLALVPDPHNQPILSIPTLHSMIPSNSHQPNHGNQLYMRTDDEDGTLSHVEDGELLSPNHSVPWSTTQPTPILMQFLSKYASPATLPLLNNHHHGILSMVTAAFIFSSSISFLPLPSDAAMSGGRMGGSFSRSYSGGGGGGRMRMASPSRSYSGGGGGSYYGGGRRSTTIVAPIISPFATPFYNPFYSPIVPYYGGGVGAISYNRGPGLFDILFLGGIGWLAVSAVSNALSTRSSSSPFESQWGDENGFMGSSSTKRNTGTSVLRLNVALDVPNRDDPSSILSVLDRMAKTTAKTDTRKGVQQLTSQVALELLRRKSSIQSAYGKGQYYKDDNTAQRAFNQASIQERSKFEKENINKFGKLDLSLSQSRNDDNKNTGSQATMAVVTLVLSLQGTNIEKASIPQSIQSISDLETILRHIASNVMMEENDLLGAEILWTPEDRKEVLTKRDVVADYPELTAL